MEQICKYVELRPGEADLKACGPLGRVGSNPTPGANIHQTGQTCGVHSLFRFLEDFGVLAVADILESCFY